MVQLKWAGEVARSWPYRFSGVQLAAVRDDIERAIEGDPIDLKDIRLLDSLDRPIVTIHLDQERNESEPNDQECIRVFGAMLLFTHAMPLLVDAADHVDDWFFASRDAAEAWLKNQKEIETKLEHSERQRARSDAERVSRADAVETLNLQCTMLRQKLHAQALSQKATAKKLLDELSREAVAQTRYWAAPEQKHIAEEGCRRRMQDRMDELLKHLDEQDPP